MPVHMPLADPIPVHVRKDYLYDGDPIFKTGVVRGSIIELLSYDDQVLTTTVLLENGAVFYHLPLHALHSPSIPEVWWTMKDCYYQNCGKGPVELLVTPRLAVRPCHVFLKGKQDTAPARGRYICTLDWTAYNLLLHVVLLDSGHFVCYPPHKILFGQANPTALPDYRKSHLDFDYRNLAISG